MTTGSVRILDKLGELITKLAERERISISATIVRALEEYSEKRVHQLQVRALTAQIIEEDTNCAVSSTGSWPPTDPGSPQDALADVSENITWRA
jgi:hypothetical protein